VSLDLAEVAYTAWADQMSAAARRLAAEIGPEFDPVFPGAWSDLDDDECATWVRVEAEFLRLVDEVPSAPQPVLYTLATPLPGPRLVSGRELKGKFPVTASTFDLRPGTAADCLAAEKHDAAEREYRIVCACMKPTNGRWSWKNLMDADAEDLFGLRRAVLTAGARLDGRLYEVYRASELERFAIELVSKLHPDDIPSFLNLEMVAPRESVLVALRSAAESRGDADLDRERWEGVAEWPDMAPWSDVLLRGAPNRYVWLRVAQALASASDDGHRLRLFSPGLPRELVARPKMIGGDVVEMLKGDVEEDKMLRLVASRCGVPRADLLRANIDDYERIFLFGELLLGNWERERATKLSGVKPG